VGLGDGLHALPQVFSPLSGAVLFTLPQWPELACDDETLGWRQQLVALRLQFFGNSRRTLS